MTQPSYRDDSEWSRHFDNETGHYYWYNEQSNESRWDNSEKEATNDAQSRLLSAEFEGSSSDAVVLENDAPTIDEVHYIRFLLINAVVFEAVLCVIESVIRCLALALLLIIIYVACCCTKLGIKSNLWNLEGIARRDLILSAAAMLTLMIPGFILFVYRERETIGRWNLAPIPTILGKVDSRRFATITIFGLGNLSWNAYGSVRHTHCCHDCWENSLLFYPKDYARSLAGWG